MENQKQLTARFLQERETKRTIRMYEVDDGSGEPLVDTLYVKQSALRKLGYKEGDTLVMTISIERK
jgi:hypothetical protein